MPKSCVAALCLFASLSLSTPAGAQDAAFSFYGLEFGMTRAAVKDLFSLPDDNLVRKPGHGMSSLELRFDRQGLLLEIRARYDKPDSKFEALGLSRALSEKFTMDVRENHPDVDISIDEFGDRTAVTLVISSRAIREMNIEHYKKHYLGLLE